MKKGKKVRVLLLLLLLIFVLTGCGNGEDDADPFDFSGVEPKDLNPWTYVEDTSISLNGALRNLASSSAELDCDWNYRNRFFYFIYGHPDLLFKERSSQRGNKTGSLFKGNDCNHAF